ncbi:terminal uridylyltransferase 4 isoform 2-T2 [Pelodytes ibericus]
MEGVSKPVSHESRKPQARPDRGDNRGVRVVTNQKHKNRGDNRLIRDAEGSSLNMVKKGKQTESCDRVLGDLTTTKEKAIYCSSGLTDLEPNLQEASQTKTKKVCSPQLSNIKQPRAAKAEQSPNKSEEATGKQNLNSQLKRVSENCPGTKRGITPPTVMEESAEGQQRRSTLSSSTLTDVSPSREPVNLETGDSTLEEQELGLKQAEERLQRDYIHRLVKRSLDFPTYQYLCKLCSIHIENIPGAYKHIKEKRHRKNILEKQEENELRALPPPTAAQITALGLTLMETAREHGISQKAVILRQNIVSNMEKVIQTQLPECSLLMYGSSMTKFALKTSDINIDVKFPPKMSHQEVLLKVLEILKNCTRYVEVESDFHAKVPVVFCTDKRSGLTCKVSAGNDTACLTTDLLAALGKLEPVVTTLVVAFRYWARLCHIDCQTEGGIPSYCFALMVVYFLQKRQSPILPAYLGAWIEGYDPKKLDEYHLMGVCEKSSVAWEWKQPSSTESKNPLPTDGAVAPDHRKTEAENGKTKQGKSPIVFSRPRQVPIGQLWLELLRFYTLEFLTDEHVICVRAHDIITRESKNWPKRRIAMEDPFAPKRNVARSLNSQMVYEYILERFRGAYKYFACPQRRDYRNSKSGYKKRGKPNKPLKQGESLLNGTIPRDKSNGSDDGVACHEAEWPYQKDVTDALHKVVGGRVNYSTAQKNQNELDDSNGEDPSDIIDLHTTEDMCNSPSLEQDCFDDCTNPTSLHNAALMDEGNFSEDDFYYAFDKQILTSGKPPTIVCSICRRDGHSKDDCPEDFKKIAVTPLPPMTPQFRDILDRVCKRCYDELSPNACEQQNREQILAFLERFIRKEFNGNARLCLFGSSKNGFGFRDSDLDICMTIEGHENTERLNCREIIEGLAKVLKKHPGLKNILPITTAKVPIVKFEHRDSGMEGDISLYNTLAQYNTRMLATYAAIDPRVKYLGYAVKFFAKRCDIGDASRGSLSSYAYILMVLYFLQQRNPPIIPVLQEIYDGQETPQRMVDGWNAFFYDNTEELRSRFPSLGKNKESVGELWLGFLRFYTEEFDFKEHVISIRQNKLLTTFEKQWTSKCIAIEDPFDLNHNLGAGVSRKMTLFIMKAFINGRKLFGTPFCPLPGHEAEYFFDSKVLTDGEHAPNDRCCRLCGKIGHYMKDCPKRRRVKRKENEKDDDKDIKVDEKRCFTCGDVGHMRKDCPESSTVRAPVPSPLQQFEQATRTRHPSESSESHHSSYSPQPQPFQQNCVNQMQPLQSTSSQKPLQVPRPTFNFPHSPPTHYPGLHNIGLLPVHHQIPLPNSSWPIHGQILRSSSGNPPHSSGVPFSARSGRGSPSTTNHSAVNLNDPSIIFAQPAARPLGVPISSHDGHWHNPQTPNGTVGNTDQGFQGPFGNPSRPWERGNAPHYPLVPGSWPYNLPQNFMQQGASGYHSKAFYPPGATLIQNGNQFPVLSQGHPRLKSGYIHQKK